MLYYRKYVQTPALRVPQASVIMVTIIMYLFLPAGAAIVIILAIAVSLGLIIFLVGLVYLRRYDLTMEQIFEALKQ